MAHAGGLYDLAQNPAYRISVSQESAPNLPAGQLIICWYDVSFLARNERMSQSTVPGWLSDRAPDIGNSRAIGIGRYNSNRAPDQ